jgi:hypothetical protein
MSNLTTRAGKGSPLTNNELDANFTNLNADKVEVGGDLSGTSSAPNVAKIQGRAVSTDAPAAGEKLVWSGTAWEPSVDPTGEPIGHADKTQSAISFNSGTRTFTIAPVASEFVVWCKGVKYTYTSAQTVVIPNTTGLHYIYFSSSGVLSTQMSFFSWAEHAPTAYIYWNATTSTAVYFGDERHGVVLDWQTHEYLHRTRGAAIANGFLASGYTLNNSATNAATQIAIESGTFFDEDMKIDIVSTATPTAGTYQQNLLFPAKIPVLHLQGTSWVMDAPTDFPFKQGTSRPQYNSVSGGVWSTADVGNNQHATTWILATNNLTYPVIAIIGQSATDNLGEAEAFSFADLTLTGFPSVEFRPLYKLIYKASDGYANSVNAQLVSIVDLRSISAVGSVANPATDHGNLSGLSDDDHAQYLHVSEVRSPTQAVKNSFLPSQTSNTGKYLSTDGTNPSWVAIPSGSLDFTGDVTGTGTTGSPVALTLANSGVTTGTYSKVTVDAKGRVTSGANIASSDVTTALGFTPENVANKAVANGYASLDSSGKVPSNQLPSYVDDVIEVANYAALPGTGETGKIYITISDSKTYRWSGSAYVEITASPGSTDAVPEGSTNLYFTNARARAAVSASGSLSYSTLTGVFSYTQPTNVSTFTNDSGYLTGITGAQVTTALGYTPPQPNGTGASGTWNISISGNAATVSSITSGQVTTALGYTPYNATNPAGYTTNVGTVTSVSGTGTVSGLTLTGSVTSSGSLTLGGTLTLTSGQVTTALGYTPYNSTNPSGYITSSSLSSYLPLSGGTLTGDLRIDSNWGSGTFNEQLIIYGTYPSMTFRSTTSDTGWLVHTQSDGGLTYYSIAGASTNNWTQQMTLLTNGELRKGGASGNLYIHTGNVGTYALPLSGGTISGTLSVSSAYGTMAAVKGSYFGYSASYGAIILGSTASNQTTCIGVDPIGNASGSFSGVGGEVMFRNDVRFITPNSSNNGYHLNVIAMSGGNVGIGQAADAGHRLIVSGNIYANSGNIYAENRVYSRHGTGTFYESLTAGNYTDYAPTKTGGYASGTWSINVTGNAATVANLAPAQFFNNMGNNHSTYTDFNNVPGFGAYYVQQGGNSPTGTASHQWYGFTLGLGNDYALSSYGSQMYYPRRAQNSDTYIYVRDREGGSWTSWTKIKAGYADSAGTADQIDGWGFVNTGSNASVNADNIDSNGISYYTAGVPNFSGNASDGALYSQAYSGSWQHQIAGDYRSGQIAIRGKNAGNWQAWRTVLDSSNVGSYALANGAGGVTIGNGSASEVDVAYNSANGNWQVGVNNYYGTNAFFWYRDGTSYRAALTQEAHMLIEGSSRAPIFYDYNNTGYYTDPASTSRLNDLRPIKITRAAHAEGFLEGSYNNVGGNSAYTNPIYTIGSSYNPTDSSLSNMYGIGYAHPNLWGGGNRTSDWGLYVAAAGSIKATLGAGSITAWFENIAFADGSFRSPIFYDSNNTAYYTDPTSVSRLNEVQSDRTYGFTDIRSPIYYDYNNTGYYIDAASTSVLNRISTVRADNWLYLDNNYGHSVVGVYASTRLQGVWAMGDSYKLAADGTSGGSLYGIAWSHPNAGGVAANLASHGMLILENGSFKGAWGGGSLRTPGDVRGTIFYDWDNTGYYCNPDGNSYLYSLTLAGGAYFRPSTWIQMDGSYGIYWPNHYGVHFYPNASSTYTQLQIDGSKNSYSGMYISHSAVNGMMYDSGGNGGVYREANGRWYFYYLVGNTCMGINTSTTSSSYGLYVSGGIYSTGNVVAYSDARRKANVVTVGGALDKVAQLRGVYYTRIPGEDDEKTDPNRREIGVIAQEVNEILPEVVTYAADIDEYGVQYGNFAGLFIEAIKELKSQVATLNAEVAELRGRTLQ